MSGIDEDDGKLMPCLTCLDEQTSYPVCVLLPSKTITSYVVEVVIDFLDRLGHQTVMWFSDGEPAMLSLMKKHLQGLIRTIKLDLEAKLGYHIKVKDAVFSWICRHVSWITARFQTRLNGQTSYQMNNGVVYGGKVVPFGECVMFRHPVSYTGNLARHVRRAKADTVWQRGIWLGKTERSDEHVIGTLTGLFKARDVKRLVPERQYDPALHKGFAITSWEPKWGIPPGKLMKRGIPEPISEDYGEDAEEVNDTVNEPTPFLSRGPRPRDVPRDRSRGRIARAAPPMDATGSGVKRKSEEPQ
eukprot:6489487-Amphidinium_carterae.2